ncbi:TerD family protein [Roseimicrobium sp. ORNL1]|nr:TerD family protein [Roseimicrobium sp. ORNL1]
MHVAEGDGTSSVSLVATLQKNLESLGFGLSAALTSRLLTLSQPRLETFYHSLVKDLRTAVGAHREYRPMYPNFPAQVMAKSEAELYFNAFLHYITNELPNYKKDERPELDQWSWLKIIDLGSKEDFESIFTRLASSRASLSEQDKADLQWFIAQYRDSIERLLPKNVPSKENMAIIGAALMEHTSLAPAFLAENLKTPTDALRLAVARSGGDVSLAAPCKFKRFRRSERKLLLSCLERHGNPVEDMLRWKEPWKRLAERLHPGDYATEFPKTYEAFRVLRNDVPVSTFASKVEGFLKTREISSVVGLLKSRPGDFARRLDHLLRLGGNYESTLDAFEAAAPSVSTPVLLQVHCHFTHRTEPADLRVFFPKGGVAKAYGKRGSLPPLPRHLTDMVVAIAETTLLQRFAKLPPLGKCYLDPALGDYLAPFSQRSASKALHTVGRGSRMPLPDGDILRFFLWWKNGKGRTDIDLSAALFSSSYRYIDILSYYNLKGFGGCHSGDIVDAPQGAAEFIDVEIPKLLTQGVRYVVMSINSYTQQFYCDLPECFAGWMSRQSAGSGEIFEPRTVEGKADIAAKTAICLPAVFDLEDRKVIWADLALTERLSWNNVHNNLSGIALMLRAVTNLQKTTLKELFDLHIKVRGTLVEDKDAADTVFSLDEGITPYDLDLIGSEFMK